MDTTPSENLEPFLLEQQDRIERILDRTMTRFRLRRARLRAEIKEEIGLDAKIGIFTGGRMGGKCDAMDDDAEYLR